MPSDPVKPSHYHDQDQSGIHCHNAQRAMLGSDGYKAYLAGMVIKYTWRHGRKNGVQDLKKASECIRMLIEENELPVNKTEIVGEELYEPDNSSLSCKVLNIVKNSGDDGISTTKVNKALNCNYKNVRSVLMDLETKGMISMTKYLTGGRPLEVWKWLRDPSRGEFNVNPQISSNPASKHQQHLEERKEGDLPGSTLQDLDRHTSSASRISVWGIDCADLSLSFGDQGERWNWFEEGSGSGQSGKSDLRSSG